MGFRGWLLVLVSAAFAGLAPARDGPAPPAIPIPGGEAGVGPDVGEALGESRFTLLATVPTVTGGQCVSADDSGYAYVCDPTAGRLLVIEDGFRGPVSRP